MLKFRLGFGMIVSCCLLVLGCSSTHSPSTNLSTAQPGAQASTQPPASSASSTAAPQSLKNTGEYAEDTYDAAYIGNWKLASAKSRDLSDATSKLQGDLQSAPEVGEIQSRVSALQKDVASKKRLAAMTDSNEITRLTAEISGKFQSIVPIQVVRLDYLGRQLQIESAEGNISSLKQTTSKVRADWNQVKPLLEQKNSTLTVNAFESIVKRLEDANTLSAFAKLAKKELDEVDKLENAFTA